MPSTRTRCCAICSNSTEPRNRRLLNGDSTRHILPVLRDDVVRNCDREAVICLSCFRDTEKIIKLRHQLAELESKILVGPQSDASVQSTPRTNRIRCRSTTEQDDEVQPSPKRSRREALLDATPTRLFMQNTVVQSSPAVAVS